MRVLLDEQMPRDLVADLTGHEVRTVGEMGWKGLENGDLLARAASQFDVLISMDRSMPAQQNIARFHIGLVLIRAVSNRIETLRPLLREIQAAVREVQPGEVRWVGA